jgi:predicted RNA binding protein YcfA (HicA-like mRNA interferase family)
MKTISRGKLIQRLKSFGFEGPCSGTRHQFMKRGALKLRIPNPHEGDISIELLRKILKQAGIDPEEFS